ncbi:MAG: FxsA family protein [Gordonia sp. (in: high G+C Gram-positive bacteria)]|uniref:FxsA family protein n=1 Tax=Gordonia sp. (in: high G+C Gram-positive bacteria) TaxID=84139 RepID=UPI0039E463D7
MTKWLFAGYVVAEIAAFWAMVHFLGWAWAIVITVAATAVGVAVLGRRARELREESRRALRNEVSPGDTLSHSALFAGAAGLTALPGVVSTVAGLVLLAPPVRQRLQPKVTAAATQRANKLVDRVTLVRMAPSGYVDGTVVDGTVAGEGYIDGSVVDTTIRNPDGSVRVEHPALPPAREH